MDFSKRVANTWLMFYKKEPTPNLSQVLAFLLLLIPDRGSGPSKLQFHKVIEIVVYMEISTN